MNLSPSKNAFVSITTALGSKKNRGKGGRKVQATKRKSGERRPGSAGDGEKPGAGSAGDGKKPGQRRPGSAEKAGRKVAGERRRRGESRRKGGRGAQATGRKPGERLRGRKPGERRPESAGDGGKPGEKRPGSAAKEGAGKDRGKKKKEGNTGRIQGLRALLGFQEKVAREGASFSSLVLLLLLLHGSSAAVGLSATRSQCRVVSVRGSARYRVHRSAVESTIILRKLLKTQIFTQILSYGYP